MNEHRKRLLRRWSLLNMDGGATVNTNRPILDVAPHLSEAEAEELLKLAQVRGVANFYGPPAVIRGAEHCYTLYSRRDELRLVHTGAQRRSESFLDQIFIGDNAYQDHVHSESIADYAEVTWGEQLQWDRTRQIFCYYVAEPDDFFAATMVWLCLENKVSTHTSEYPILQQVETNLFYTTDNPIVATEFEKGLVEKPILVQVCRACCGAIIQGVCMYCRSCTQVHVHNQDPDIVHPLPLAAKQHLDTVNVEVADPLPAIKHYYMKWATNGWRPSDTNKRLRQIELQ